MNINELLKGRKCGCGMVHTCSIEHVIIGENAIFAVKETVSDYHHILIAADKNTYAVCGDEVKKQAGGRCENVLVYEADGLLVPNEAAVEQMQGRITDKTDLILGIGSGVIQDICKYVSYEAGLPYQIVATAPSMDGYASVGAAMIMNHMKVTYSTHVPEAIIGDVDVLRNAPLDMIKSGYGDIIGKYSCLNDWKLSALVNGEYFCDYVYHLTYEMVLKTKNLGQKLLDRDSEAIRTLMEALVGVGIAMAYVGNSRPASGSEHHMSHFFEVIGIMNAEPYFLHGIDVAYSAVYTQTLREELLKLKAPPEGYRMSAGEYEGKMKAIYGDAAGGIITLQDKLGRYEKDYMDIYTEKWPEIREILAQAPSSGELVAYIESVGLDMGELKRQYGEEKIQNAVWFAKDLKDRYSVLWLYYHLFYPGRE